MLLTIVSATAFEISPLREMLTPYVTQEEDHYEIGELQIHLLQCGIGLVHTALHLSRYFQFHSPQLTIHAGIAGSYRHDLPLGTTGLVISERYADLGAELDESTYADLFELGLADPNAEPFTQGRILNLPDTAGAFLPQWHGLSVQRVTGSASTIQKMRAKYPDADIESMEGASFFHTCKLYGKHFLEIRSISNYVEPRNRANWKVKEAVQSLNDTLIEMVKALAQV